MPKEPAPQASCQLKELSHGARAELFALLTSSDTRRAATIGRLYASPRTKDLAEVLVDLEVEPILRLELARIVRDSLRGVAGA